MSSNNRSQVEFLTLDMERLTSDQVDAITHAWLDLCACKEHLDAPDEFIGCGAEELLVACEDSVEELEKEFFASDAEAGEEEDSDSEQEEGPGAARCKP